MLSFQNLLVSDCRKGQSAIELAIFGSILIFVITLIFRQGLSGGNFMKVQLQATRYAMSKSLETSMLPIASQNPSRNNASTLVIEDRLSGDFASKFSSRDRVPLIASASASFSNQLFYPIEPADFGDDAVLSVQDVWVNGQRLSFTTAGFRTVYIPQTQGNLALCTQPHLTDTRCWDPACPAADPANPGCVVLQKVVQNYPGSKYSETSGNFDVNFTGVDSVAQAGISKAPMSNTSTGMSFMWQWQGIHAMGELKGEDSLDVDGDFYEEQFINAVDNNSTGRTVAINVIDRQNGDFDYTVDGRRPGVQVGLLPEARMYSYTRQGTYYQVREGKLFGTNEQFIRNVNASDQVDIVERMFQLSNDTGRFCDSSGRPNYTSGAWRGIPQEFEKACGNCFSSVNIKLTCFEPTTLRLYVRSNIENKAGRAWITRTEP